MEISPDIFGYAGTITGASFLLPQVYKSWKTKNVQDLSWGMLILFFFNSVFWLIYGILLPALPVAITNASGLSATFILLTFKWLYAGRV